MNIFLKNHTIPLKLNTLLQHCSLSENLFYSFEDGWIGGCEESMAWWKLQSCRWKQWPFNRRWRKRERQKDVLAENGTKLVFKNQEPSWHSHLSLDHSRRKKHSWLQRMEIHQPQQGLVWSGWLRDWLGSGKITWVEVLAHLNLLRWSMTMLSQLKRMSVSGYDTTASFGTGPNRDDNFWPLPDRTNYTCPRK